MKLPSKAPIITQKIEPITQKIMNIERKPVFLPSIILIAQIIDIPIFHPQLQKKLTGLV